MHVPPRPPSPDTVGQAISLLLGSVRRIPDVSESNPIEYSREKEIAELEIAASAIHDELLLRAAMLKRQRNSSQWIYRLPQEVFTEILVFDIRNPPEERKHSSFRRKYPVERPKPPRRTQLCNVSHRFLQTIMGTPRIWSDIRWRRDDHVRCLEMSAQAPLSIRCSELDRMEIPSPASMEEFLEAVWEQSWRWQSLCLNLEFSPGRLNFLEFTAPRIHDVTIQNFARGLPGIFGETEPVPCVLKIFGNPTLRTLSLDGIGLHWDDLNLSHLRSLSLTKIKEGAPSFEKLMEILQSASGLEQLTLHGLNTFCPTEEQERNTQPIHLTSLLSLWLDELPKELPGHIIRLIRFPRLKSMRVRGLSLEHLENSNSDQNPHHHFFQILVPMLSSSEGLTLSNETFSNVMYLNTDFWTDMPWPDGEAPGETADIGVEVEDPLSAMQNFANFLTSNHLIAPLTIEANGYNYTLDDPSSMTPKFPVDVLGKLPTVTRISAGTLADALNIMTFLGSIRRDEETGRLGWACPRLKDLDFSAVEGLTPEHTQAFLDARYSDGNPLLVEGETVHRPPMVELGHSIFWET
ncbi:hypothetical protein FS837_011853 [Tulasnella sp. UAMH 9824]|nr:hypothetical protein FS837_011853 [Tulasnella sp. UAMH 9824]